MSNHLDVEAMIWLTEYLKRFRNTVLMVSHDRDRSEEERDERQGAREIECEVEGVLGEVQDDEHRLHHRRREEHSVDGDVRSIGLGQEARHVAIGCCDAEHLGRHERPGEVGTEHRGSCCAMSNPRRRPPKSRAAAAS